MHAASAPVGFDQPRNLGFHAQGKTGKHFAFIAQEIQKVPLRHHRDEWCGHGKMAEVGNLEPLPIEFELPAGDAVMRAREEPLEHAQFMQEFHGRGVHSVAAEIAEEIGVLFQHQRLDACAGEQQPRHHARRAAADNDNICCEGRVHEVTFAPNLQ